jgi:hypothetical protein
MDDIIFGFECGGVPAKLNLQAKRKIQISATNRLCRRPHARSHYARFAVL